MQIDIWLEWLEDEQHAISLTGQKLRQSSFERVQSLFQKATSDYLSVNIWLKWADFMELAVVESLEAMQSAPGEDAPEVTFDDVRAFYEAALEHVQWHSSRAGEMWVRYRAFEDLVASVADVSEEVVMVERKRAIFHRELAHPHTHLQKMYDEEYLPWERTVGDAKAPANDASHAEVLKLLGTSLDEFRRRQEHESVLHAVEVAYEENHTPDYTKLEAIRKYLKYEQSHSANASGRVTCLYERIIAIYFLALDIWQSYSQTLLKAPSTHETPVAKLETALAAQRRAVRNYPYTHHMWCQLIMTLEQYSNLTGKKAEARAEITDAFERALQAGMHNGQELVAVYLQFLDYRLRAVTDWSDETQSTPVFKLLESARSYFESYLPDFAFEIEEYWATIALTKMLNITMAREVYETSLKRDSTRTRTWLSYAQFEKLQSLTDLAREVFKRAAAVNNLDAPEHLWSQWLSFERAFGNFDTFAYASEKVEKKEREHTLKNAANAAKQEEALLAAADEELGPRKSSGRKQQKSAGQDSSNSGNRKQANSRKLVKGSDGEAVTTGGKGKSRKDHNDQAHPHGGKIAPNKPSPNYDPTTLHVAGLPAVPELLESITPEQISALFSSFGAIADVRFPVNPTGQRKGFVYVQYADASASKAARASIKEEKNTFILELPVGTELKQYPLRVNSAVATKPHKAHGPKKAPVEGLEEYKHTVFVSNLSALTTLAKLETCISTSGSPVPVAIRMPTDRKSGASRCIAYLDFDNQLLVADAVTALNDKMLDGRRIHAAPSAPTKERTPHAPHPSAAPANAAPSGVGALGGKAAEEAEKHAASLSSQPKLVPRSVAMRGPGSGGPKTRIAPLAKQSSKMDTS